MKTENFKAILLKNLFLPLLAVVVFISTPLYDNISKNYIDSSLKGAVVTYALLRTLNAGVSVIQKSSVTLGVGIEGNIAIGEVLDPINDAVERFSDMITLSIWALGSEKALYEISKTKLVIVFVILLAILSLFYKNRVVYKFLTVLIIVRLFIPFSALASHYFNSKIFDPEIQKSLNALKFAKSNTTPKIRIQKNSTFWDEIQNGISDTAQSYKEFKKSMSFYINNATHIINELVNLSVFYFGKYLLNLLLLPLLLVYVIQNSVKEKL
jgi:hypothetical protein